MGKKIHVDVNIDAPFSGINAYAGYDNAQRVAKNWEAVKDLSDDEKTLLLSLALAALQPPSAKSPCMGKCTCTFIRLVEACENTGSLPIGKFGTLPKR